MTPGERNQWIAWGTPFKYYTYTPSAWATGFLSNLAYTLSAWVDGPTVM